MDFETFDGKDNFAEYANFYVDDDIQHYRLSVGAVLNSSGSRWHSSQRVYIGGRNKNDIFNK